MNYFTGLAKGEIAALAGAGDDARYFQTSLVLADGHHAAGQFGRRWWTSTATW
jgi:hypothetical protein